MAMSDAHDDAVDRLHMALGEQERLQGRFHAAINTTGEFGAYARLRAARKEVTARQTVVDNLVGGRVGSQAWVNGRAVGGDGSIFQ